MYPNVSQADFDSVPRGDFIEVGMRQFQEAVAIGFWAVTINPDHAIMRRDLPPFVMDF